MIGLEPIIKDTRVFFELKYNDTHNNKNLYLKKTLEHNNPIITILEIKEDKINSLEVIRDTYSFLELIEDINCILYNNEVFHLDLFKITNRED